MSNNSLEKDKDYPFRASLTKVARCGMCLYNGHFKNGCLTDYDCEKDHDIKYPTITNEHDCKDYKYLDDTIEVKEGMIYRGYSTPEPEFPECKECGYNFKGKCSGIQWIPIPIKNGKCQFFRDKNLICKYAIPTLQYSNHFRNNFCSLDPKLRDGDMKRGWKWMCPTAHEKYAEHYKCYKSKGEK